MRLIGVNQAGQKYYELSEEEAQGYYRTSNVIYQGRADRFESIQYLEYYMKAFAPIISSSDAGFFVSLLRTTADEFERKVAEADTSAHPSTRRMDDNENDR